MSGYTADVGADVVDFAHAEAKDFSQVFLFDRLLLDWSSDRIALFPHQRILSILISVVLTRIVTLSSEVLKSSHDSKPLDRARFILEIVTNGGPIWVVDLFSN